MDHPRQVRHTVLEGAFLLPVGLRLFDYPPAHNIGGVTVSTVCLDGAHLEDPLGVLDAESGYETMVFFKGCTMFDVYRRQYKTRRSAKIGHEKTVRSLLDGSLPLRITLGHYRAYPIDQAA